ncbi:MAG TPA: ABC transporter ATP-binding protein [Anaerolineaceae bacterium]|nr:ABC transporter ATP-binding protein [Anaerolineaceae bacterium]
MAFYAGLDSETYDRQYSNKALLYRIWSYAQVYKKQIFIILIAIILHGSVGALPPLLISKVLDEGIAGVPDRNVFYLLAAMVILVEVLGFVFYYINHRLLARVIADVNRDLSTDAFAASMRQDMAFHDHYSSGRILSRITTDTRDFSTFIKITMDVANSALQSLVTAIILINTQWRLAATLFMVVPVVIIVVSFYRSLARKFTRQGMRAMANVNATIKETISGIAIAKNFRQEESIYRDFKQTNTVSYDMNVKRGLILSVVFPTTRALGGIATAVIVYTGSNSVMAGLISAGAWYMFVLSIDRFLQPVMALTSYWTQVQTGLSAAERIFALIDAEHTVIQTGNYVPTQLRGKIDFNQLTFRYNTGKEVLKDFDLHIQEGENVAIVGHTGAGKTSIARLIARFYEFQSGELLIDDRDIRSYNLHALRQHMGLVTQVPFLFEGTVEENIRFSQPEISREEILDLAYQIGDGEWLDTFGEGLDTVVGERGAQISMGQRQLVALMRVLAQKPSVFILDEATASIDPFTEKQIQTALNLILKQSTSVLIAHRLSTVQSADRIIVLEEGVILEEGNHWQLLQRSGYYADLYNTYFRHQSLEYVEKAGQILRSKQDLSSSS